MRSDPRFFRIFGEFVVAVMLITGLPLLPGPVLAQEPGPRSGATVFSKGFSYQSLLSMEKKSGNVPGLGGSVTDFRETRWIQNVAYSPVPDWQLFVSMPYVTKSREGTDGTGNFVEQSTSGRGDALVLIKNRFYRNDVGRSTAQAAWSLGPELPTGEDDETDGSGNLLPPEMQPGSGSTDWVGALASQYVYKRTVFKGSMIYKMNTEGTQNYEAGDIALLEGSYNYHYYMTDYPGPQAEIGAGLLYRWQGRAEQNGITEANTGGSQLFLKFPKGHFAITPSFMVHYSLEWPVVQDLNGQQLEEDVFVQTFIHWQTLF